jgi:hypothetical protein
MRALGLAVVVVSTSLALQGTVDHARACAACTTGDPTLTAFGTEEGYPGRLRIALEARSRHDALGPPIERVEVSELRTELGLAWAPTSWLFVQLAAPLLVRDVSTWDGGSETSLMVGDLGLRARFDLGAVVAGLSLSAGLSLPTAPRLERAGRPLAVEVQPGSGSFDPALGIAWSVRPRPWAVTLSAYGVWPTGDANPQLHLVATGQREVWRDGAQALALRAVLEGRVDGKARENGSEVADSGGFIAFAGLDLVLSPGTDWQVELGARVPIADALVGYHDESTFFVLAVAHDLR